MNTKEFLKREWALWIIILAPLVFALVRWNDFPEKVPLHWGVNGEVDKWGSKVSVLLSPGLNVIVYLLMLFLPKIDPRKKNYDLFGGTYFIFRAALSAFLALTGFVTMLFSLGWKINVVMIVIYSVLVLFLIMGNQFGRIRPNYFVGLRTPWTLNNEIVWTRTHRFAGRLWVVATLLIMAAAWALPLNVLAIVFIGYILLLVIPPVVYSWKIHKEIMEQNMHPH